MPEVRAWLEALGLGQYAETFAAEEIELDDLRDLVDADLEKLGLPMGPRKRLLRAIAALAAGRSERRDAAGEPPSPKFAPAPLAAKILKARPSIEGERKQVTILFADVEGSTDLVQHLDAEEVSRLFDPLQKIMIDAVLPSRADTEQSWTVTRAEIEARNYDLKAVNPNTKPAENARTPAELIDAIEARGREITDALAELRRLTDTFE